MAGNGWPVLEESDSYYIVKTSSNVEAMPKSDWEPVPTETWRDVTAECVVRYCHIEHDGSDIGSSCYIDGPAYRLRKVQLCKHGDYEHAFIIEKREP
jgi:hypothetical protein